MNKHRVTPPKPAFFPATLWGIIGACLLPLVLAGCASSLKYQKSFLEIGKAALAVPLVELEEFPSGRALQSPEERTRLLQAFCLRLEDAFYIGNKPEVSAEMPESVQKQMRKLFVTLQTAPDLGSVELGVQLQEFLQLKFGNEDVLVAYYSGFQRLKESMTSGYHSAAFKTELVPRAFSKDIEDDDFAHSPQGMAQGRYQVLPDQYGATLKILVIRGSKKDPVYFDMVHTTENPLSPKVLPALVEQLAQAMKNKTGDYPGLPRKSVRRD